MMRRWMSKHEGNATVLKALDVRGARAAAAVQMQENIKKEAREMAAKKFRRDLSTYEQSVLDLLDSDLESVLDCGERTNAASDML